MQKTEGAKHMKTAPKPRKGQAVVARKAPPGS